MRGTRLTKSVALGLALAAPLHSTSGAQQPTPAGSSRGYWFTGALGVAHRPSSTGSGALTAALGAHVQRGGVTGSVRWHSVGNGIGGTEITALSLLGGVASTTAGAAFWAVSGGVTGLRQRDCTAGCGLFADTGRELGPARSGVGVMVAADAALRLGNDPGGSIGLTGFASLNTRQSFAGVGLEIGIGKWR